MTESIAPASRASTPSASPSDSLTARYAKDALRYAILAVTGFYIIAAILFVPAARWLPRDWHD